MMFLAKKGQWIKDHFLSVGFDMVNIELISEK